MPRPWDANPFAGYELRSRWRTDRAFWYLFAYAAFLAVCVGWQDWQAGHRLAQSGQLTLGHMQSSYAALGHEMFVAFAWSGTLCWLALSPTLTAGSVTGERERGLLDGILLSQLSPHEILAGKFSAAMLFAGCMFLATIPVGTLSLLFTGVSPGEFCLVIAVQAMTAIFGAMLALTVSVVSQRSSQALRASLAIIGFWLIFTFGICQYQMTYTAPSSTTGANELRAKFFDLLFYFGKTNPVLAIDSALQLRLARGAALPNWWSAPCAVTLEFEFLASVALFYLGAARFGRPLADADWMEVGARRQSLRTKAEGSAVLALGAGAALKLNDPMLTRELRSRMRFRRPTRMLLLVQLTAAAYLAHYCVSLAVAAWHSHPMREDVWGGLVLISMGSILGYAAVASGGAVARERERGTWESIGLSLLSPVAVVRAKMRAVLLACLALSLFFWPLIFVCYHHTLWGALSDPTSGIPGRCVLAWALNLAGGCIFASATGLWISSWHQRSAVAITWTIATLLALWILAPILLSLQFFGPLDPNSIEATLGLFHPLMAPMTGFNGPENIDFTSTGIPFFGLAVLAAIFMMRATERFIGREWRLPDADLVDTDD